MLPVIPPIWNYLFVRFLDHEPDFSDCTLNGERNTSLSRGLCVLRREDSLSALVGLLESLP
jgi:hypothetical protein